MESLTNRLVKIRLRSALHGDGSKHYAGIEPLKNSAQNGDSAATGNSKFKYVTPNIWTSEDENTARSTNQGFRSMTVMPNADDIFGNRATVAQSTLRPNIVAGKYVSVNHYLDTQFRLLREDFIRPLRDDLTPCKQKQTENNTDVVSKPLGHKFENARVFNKVSVMDAFYSNVVYAKVNWVHFDPWSFQDIDWATSKHLIYGSLVLLSHDNFRTIWWGTVVERADSVQNGWVLINFGSDAKNVPKVQRQCEKENNPQYQSSDGYCEPFVMLESVAFFQAYRSVLEALQSFDAPDFPFSRYFVSCKFNNIPAPSYINRSTQLDMSSLIVDHSSVSPDKIYCNALNKSAWPSADQLGLNTSQYNALQMAISSELAIIQGPPGTGKSFIGRKILQLILANSWCTDRPILVVCFTNHALDAFLESILSFINPEDLIRVGRQCKSEALKEYCLSEILDRHYQSGSKKRIDVVKLLRSFKIIGMTTSGAAFHHKKLQKIQPAIAIIEEAAEVLEAHIIASLSPGLRHLILIGDHHQLRPNPTVHNLAINYNLEISLFERLINNGCPYACLAVQHRMRPEISRPLMPHFYDCLTDHASVSRHENIRGVTSNICFLEHKHPETASETNETTHQNPHEAKFVAALALYFIQQGYAASQITILTPYLGQVRTINERIGELSNEADIFASQLIDVKVTSVDNYQGEENDIIILSLVRSNLRTVRHKYYKNNIGFLSRKNRVCVAMSRARKGFFVIGNFHLFISKASFWKDICYSVAQVGGLCSELSIQCSLHDKSASVRSGNELQAASPDGGCKIRCKVKMVCGHTCERYCHPGDPEHKRIKCYKPCRRPCTTAPRHADPHECKSTCADCWRLSNEDDNTSDALVNECRPCETLVDRVVDGCGHLIKAHCGQDQATLQCTYACPVKLPCGHQCDKGCHSDEADHTEQCQVIVSKHRRSCGHSIKTECHNDPDTTKCGKRCGMATRIIYASHGTHQRKSIK